MSFNLLSGKKIPLIGVGTWQLTGYDKVYNCLDTALGVGYRMIDTAHVYQNEEDIGKCLKELLPKHGLKREDIYLTTKLQPCNKQEAIDGVKASLKRLQTEYIDLFLIHYPKFWGRGDDKDPNNKVIRKETWLALEEAVANGTIKSIGVSNYEVKHLKEFDGYAKIKPDANQCEFHPYFTREELHKYCKDNKIFFQAYSSLGSGRSTLMEEKTIKDMAEKHKATPAQILLGFALSQNVGVLPKSQTKERVKENFESIKTKLSEKEIQELNKLNKNENQVASTPWLID